MFGGLVYIWNLINSQANVYPNPLYIFSILEINTVLELYILYIESLENQFADICYDIFMLTNCISGNKNAFNKQNTFDL